MERREVLRLLGGVAAVPALSGLSAERLWALGRDTHERANGSPRALTAHQLRTVSTIADIILPRTATPGATDVGVPAFVDLMLAEWYAPSDREAFLAGLADLDARAGKARQGAGTFLDLRPSERRALVETLDGAKGAPDSAESAFATLKHLTVYGYFTSREVMVKVRKVPIWPGRFDGCTAMGR